MTLITYLFGKTISIKFSTFSVDIKRFRKTKAHKFLIKTKNYDVYNHAN